MKGNFPHGVGSPINVRERARLIGRTPAPCKEKKRACMTRETSSHGTWSCSRTVAGNRPLQQRTIAPQKDAKEKHMRPWQQ